MKTEEGWRMYNEIQDLKKNGLNKSQISRRLGISRPTVIKYYSMDADGFKEEMEDMHTRERKPEKFHTEILDWLIKFSDMSGAQIYDRLEEKYGELGFCEGTLRSYVRILRKEHDIPKKKYGRDYEAMDDPPMGKQMQVDFGQIKVMTPEAEDIKLYAIGFVLSNSRYKYCEWQDRPFSTMDVIRAHENAFDFYGGMTEEIVYDQDRLILVSENHGDLIFTHEFSSYKSRRGFRVYMCRKEDPESKGRIENVIGYVKNNFAKYRTIYNLQRWNEECISWLKRRGNGKKHETTKKIPAEVFVEEKKYLKPVSSKINIKPCGLSITYQVRKDNTIPVGGNRYRVPKGTYKGPDTYVRVKKLENKHLVILDLNNDIELARYSIPVERGKIIDNNDHKRDKGSKIPNLMDELAERFKEPSRAKDFLEKIRESKPRYIRDQLQLISESIKDECTQTLEKAFSFCERNHLYSGSDFKDAVKHFSKERPQVAVDVKDIDIIPLNSELTEKMKMKPRIRDIHEYTRLFNSKRG